MRPPCCAARKGDQLSRDHIIPQAIVPELDNIIANLEMMPVRLTSKNSHVGGEAA